MRERLRELRELVDLDCEAARAETEELRERLHADADALALLEDDLHLRRGTVSDSLPELERELGLVETRIERILEYRMRLNQTVEDAILNGDGTIRTDDETGGDADGDGDGTAPENPGAAGAD